jgi:NMD protein affecting ribosome stability and mRNA decay
MAKDSGCIRCGRTDVKLNRGVCRACESLRYPMPHPPVERYVPVYQRKVRRHAERVDASRPMPHGDWVRKPRRYEARSKEAAWWPDEDWADAVGRQRG